MIAHPIYLAVATALAIVGCLFGFEYRLERKSEHDGLYITLTPLECLRGPRGEVIRTDKVVDFNPRLEHYLKVAEVMVTLASASLVLIPTLHIDKTHPMFAYAMVLLGFTVVFAVTFMATMAYFYEMFLFNPASFNALRSSFVFAVGFSGHLCFAIAYLVLAIQIAIAYTNGTLTGSVK
jgi:hypothetical protein